MNRKRQLLLIGRSWVRGGAAHPGRLRLALSLALLLALIAALAIPVAAVGEPPAKRGDEPYAVGLRHYTFVDSSRRTPPNRSFPGAPDRTLKTILLYPAAGEPGGSAVTGATPLRTTGNNRFPLIVFSHGLGAVAQAYQPLLERFAAAGYVIAAPNFPLSSAGSPGGVTLGDYTNQPADVSFVLTRTLELAREDRSLRNTIDRDHVGVLGHSLGAITTLGVATNSCCLDPRIDAAVAWSGIELPFGGGSFFSGPTPPLLLVHGDADGTVPYQGSVSAYAQAPAPKALLTLEGGGHVPFLSPWLVPIVDVTTDFLDGYLKGDSRALARLATDGNVPGVASLQQDLGG